ncbi:diacylglycerol kinase family lipid kinase [Citricoccus sp. SGAir0253]|uniref:diacylglycerol/lipid kinase family protein n=1 Tax=Citricoccus sp. SGAir0253 TaxID=2567881 RepID=UPI0010CCD235|nr:diacylglycerol kinase family protein [Citricoccus sp. SGAir0253]QCU77740.1 diacylglycerol kinase family lipid kinase [Citricoccus sp. SGAir0253]
MSRPPRTGAPHPAERPLVLLCVNPASGRGRGAGAGAEAAARLRSGGADVEVLAVPRAGGGVPAEGYARALAERLAAARGAGAPTAAPDAVVVVGGDGMVHVTANVLAGTSIPLGLVPAGTGNDIARSLGCADGDIGAAVERVLRSLRLPPRRIDLARVELAPLPGAVPTGPEFTGDADGPGRGRVRRHVVAGVDVAFDAAVTARANRMRRPRGRARYVLAVLAELPRHRPARLRITLEGPDGPARLAGPAFLFAVMNGRFIGGGMEVTPGSRPDDGVLEAFLVRPLPAARFLRLFPRVFTGAHAGLPEVDIRRTRAVRIEAEPPARPAGRRAGRRSGEPPVLHGDGEPLGRLPATVTVDPGALAVLDDGGAGLAPTLEP